MDGGLSRLRSEIAAEGGLAAAALGPADGGDQGGEFVLEAVREGYLLHHGESRLFRTDDRDLRLLVGDRCYAIGLCELADSGDLAAIEVLSRLISGGARAHAERDPDAAEALWADAQSAVAAARDRAGNADCLSPR